MQDKVGNTNVIIERGNIIKEINGTKIIFNIGLIKFISWTFNIDIGIPNQNELKDVLKTFIK